MHISRYTMFLFIIFTLSFSETKAQQVNFISLAKKAQFLTAFSKGILGITQSALTKNTGPLAKNLRTGAHVARIANSIFDAINYHQSERSSALTTSIMQQKYNAFWLSYDSLALYNHLFATQESGGDDEEIITTLNEIDPSWQSHLKKTCALFLPLAESTLACLVAYNNSNLKTSEESLMMLRALESAIRSLDVFLTAPAYSSKMQLFGALLAVSLIDAIFKPFIATTSQQNPTPQKPSSTGSTTPKTQQSPQSTPATPRSEEPQSTATETAPVQAPVDEFLAQALQESALTEQAIRERQERDEQNLTNLDDAVEALSLIVTTAEEVIDHSASSTDALSSTSPAQTQISEVALPVKHTSGRNHFAVLTKGFPTIESYFKN